MSFLNHNQIEDYNKKGYVSPINIFSKQEAKEIREEIETTHHEDQRNDFQLLNLIIRSVDYHIYLP